MVTCNRFLCHLGQTIRKNLFLLDQDEEGKRVFSPDPFVSFRTARTLRTHLVRAKVYPAENIVETDTFQSFADKRFIRSITDLHVVMNV